MGRRRETVGDRLSPARALLVVFGLALLALATPASAQNAPPAAADGSAVLRDYLRLVDGILAIDVALGRTSGPEADARLQAAGRDFVARGAPEAELVAMRSQLQVAAGGFFADLDRDLANAASFPGPLPVEVSRALGRRLLGSARSKLDEALAEGRDPLPILAQASKVLARVRGFTDLPRELDRFADAAERAERIAATLPPPRAAGPGGTMPPASPVGPVAVGGPMAQGRPPATPGSVPAAQPGPGPAPGVAYPPPASGIPRALPPPGTSAPGGMTPAAPAPAPGSMGPPRAPMPAPGMTPANPPGPARAPSPSASPTVAVPPSDPMLAVLGVGTMEAEARLEGLGWMDVVGRTWPPSSDGKPDTEIVLKLLAPGLVLDWIEIRSAPDPTEAIWTTAGTAGTLPIGLVHKDRLLNDPKGNVSGLQIEDFVVLKLYVQDDGLLERLEQPGTITITYRGGDVATIPIQPMW